jgi:hypothetical protein
MRVREKLAFIIILFSAKLLFAFQVQPPLFEFSLKKGDTKEFTVDIINNDSPKPLNLQIRTENLIQDDEGEVSSIKENTQWGCADWITIDLPEENGYSHISIPAERDTTIKISLSVPRDTKLAGGRYGAVLIQTIPDKKSMEKSAALISYGIGVSIKVDVLGTKHVKTAEVAKL